jgi:hypothetical protein
MKTMKGVNAAVLVLVGIWAVSAHAQDGASCSNASLSGAYAITISGSITGVGPVSVVGIATFDGNGNIPTNIGHIVVNGTQPPVDWLTGTGTYDVNANCTGKIHLVFDNGLTRDIFIVVARKGHELRGVNAEPAFNAISNGVKLDSPF